MPKRNHGVAAVLLLLASLPAFAQGAKTPAPGAPAPPAGAGAALAAELADLPEALGDFRRRELVDFESRPQGTGLGIGVDHRSADGGVATLYWYDRGRRDLREADPAAVTEQEMATARREIQASAAQRNFRIAAIRPLAPIPLPDGRPGLRCEAVDEDAADGRRDSYLCAGVLRARILKLRITFPANASGQTEPRVRSFATQVLAALAPRAATK